MIVLCSGGFDPLHDGHLDYLEGAAKYGKVIVALNSEMWVVRKKGWQFMPWLARARILKCLSVVYDVISVNDGDGTVCQALVRFRPRYFANGGDRNVANKAEDETCKIWNIEQLFGVGGPKVRSSSNLVLAESMLADQR